MFVRNEVLVSIALGWAWDTYVAHRRKKLLLDVIEENETLRSDVRYLCDVLNKNKIRLDEFDKIALHHVTTGYDLSKGH